MDPGEGEMELPANEFGDMILPPFHEDPSRLHQVGFDLEVNTTLEVEELGSPSHALRVGRSRGRSHRRRIFRTVIWCWMVASGRWCRRFCLAGERQNPLRRDHSVIEFRRQIGWGTRVVILLDRSGSMAGITARTGQEIHRSLLRRDER